jgi:hypothetical protein
MLTSTAGLRLSVSISWENRVLVYVSDKPIAFGSSIICSVEVLYIQKYGMDFLDGSSRTRAKIWYLDDNVHTALVELLKADM